MPPHEGLLAWQRCHELVLSIYLETRSWPADERFGLITQVRRAAVSAAANIVEGNTRRGSRELGRFLQIAAGSLAEVGYLLRLADDLNYGAKDDTARLRELQSDAARLTWCFLRRIRQAAAE